MVLVSNNLNLGCTKLYAPLTSICLNVTFPLKLSHHMLNVCLLSQSLILLMNEIMDVLNLVKQSEIKAVIAM